MGWTAALAALLVCPALALAMPARTAAATTPECDNVTQPGIIPGTTPLLFVHGIDSGPATWTGGTVSGTSVAPLNYVDGALGTQVTGYTFDWSTYSGLKPGSTLAWVNGPPAPGPGPLLAQAIQCLASKSGHKVIIIAHSMGGLVTEDASTLDSAANDIAAVFTLGTPFKGSQLDSAATGPLGWLTQTIAATCAFRRGGAKQHVKTNGAISVAVEPLCRVVSERDDPGMVAMRTDAAPKTGWRALHWSGSFPVFRLAASIQETNWQPLPLFGPQITLADIGDFVVSTSSELGPATTPPAVTCTVPLTGTPQLLTLLGEVTALSCLHTNEPDNKTLLDNIISTIKQNHMIPTSAPTTPSTQPAPSPTPSSTPAPPSPAPSPASPSPRSVTVQLTIAADAGWVDTGLQVDPSDDVNISASGSWTPDGVDYAGPDGFFYSPESADNYFNTYDLGTCADCATTDAPFWAELISYTGNSPPEPGSYTSTSVAPQAALIDGVGSTFQGSWPYSGEIWLGFNDDAYSGNTSDNYGEVTATITVTYP